MDTNLLFSGTYLNPITPLWASASAGGAIGTDIQVSTVTVNGGGAIIMDATAPVVFSKTTDPASDISIIGNIPPNGGSAVEHISIVNDTKTYYDPLAVGELWVYGTSRTVLNPEGTAGVIGQFGSSSDMEIVTTGLHVDPLFVSSINGLSYPPGDLGPNPGYSTITMNSDDGRVILTAVGSVSALQSASIQFQYTGDYGSGGPQLQMATNIITDPLPAGDVENVSLILDLGANKYYETLALGNILVYGINNTTTSASGQVAEFRQWQATTDIECVTTGFHVSSLTVSSINGSPPGGGAGGPNLLVSTIQVNPTGQITMTANVNASTSQIAFNRTPGFGSRPSELSMTTTNLKNASGAIVATQTLAVTDTIAFSGLVTYDNLAVGNLAIYGAVNPVTSTIGQLGVFETWTQGSTDIQLRTTGFHTSSIFASTITCDEIISAQPLSVSTINTQSIDASLIRASTLALFNNAPVDLGGINLGLGEFLGNYTGAFAGQTLAMTLAGSALGISLIGAIAPRLEGNITPPGEVSTFQTINLQTQLQFSTIGSQVSSFYRFVSSTDGLNGTVTPGQEYIVSSIIAPGTLCLRSFSDPINLANPSTFTSTVQSFGYWIPVPQLPASAFSTVTGNFNVQSTLTAYQENISTTLNVVGLITGGNVASGGTVTAATNIVAGGTVQVGANLTVAGLTTLTGQLIAPLVSATTVNTASINSIGINNNINIINTNYISTNYVQSGTLDAPVILTSSISLSTINGLPYNPGGPNASGIFSTLIVSSIATVSSLTVTGTTNTSTINTNNVSTFSARANNITATTMTFGSPLTTTTLNNAGGIFNNNTGVITYPSAVISSVNTNNISTSRVNAPIISTQQLFISTVNGLTYPPAFNSTIQGNLYVTSTLDAHNINSDTTILATGNITSATGDMIAINAQFNQITSLGNITASALLTGAVGGIGGVTLGATTLGRTSGDIYGKDIKVSTINTNGASIFNGNLNVNSPGAIFTNQLQLQNGGIFGVSSINNVAYPPFIPTQSTFNQIFTSSIQASTMNTINLTTTGLATTTGLTNLGNISTTSINLPSISIGTPTIGFIGCEDVATLSVRTTDLFASRITSLSSVTVSSINGFTYPPNGGVNGVFSTILVSSIATVGSVNAGGGNVGGVTFPGGGVAQGSIFAASNVNATVGVNAIQFISTATVNATNIITTTETARKYLIFNSTNLFKAGLYGGVNSEIFLSTSVSTIGFFDRAQNFTYVAPTFFELNGNNVGFGSNVTTIQPHEIEMLKYNQTTGLTTGDGILISPGLINIGTPNPTDLAFTTNGSATITGNVTIGGNLDVGGSISLPSSITVATLSASTITTNQISSFNNSQVPTTNQIGSQLNTGIQTRFGPNPAGVGIAQLITGTIYQSGQYQWGGSFLPNVPRTMPTVYFSCLFPCGVDVLIQSFSNGGGSNAQTMAASFKMFFGRQNASVLGGQYQDVVNSFTYYQNNCVMTVIPIAGEPSSYLLAPYTTINDGRPPSQVVISWKVQPAFVLGSS
jgi:hypothetical protein